MSRAATKGVGYWLTMLLALVLGVVGAVLLGGGVWLIGLGGSPTTRLPACCCSSPLS